MDGLYIILGLILVIISFVGCILPGIPETPLSYIAVLLLYFTGIYAYSSTVLIVLLGIVLFSIALDFLLPIIGTKKSGGSKYGVYGSILGLMASFFIAWILGPLAPFAFIIFPFIGAFIGEVIVGKQTDKALKAAFGSVIGFFVGIGLKLILTGIVAYQFFKGAFSFIRGIDYSSISI